MHLSNGYAFAQPLNDDGNLKSPKSASPPSLPSGSGFGIFSVGTGGHSGLTWTLGSAGDTKVIRIVDFANVNKDRVREDSGPGMRASFRTSSYVSLMSCLLDRF